MRRIAIVIPVLAASMMITALPALPDKEIMEQPGQTQQKDECLLYAKNCAGDISSIQQRIDRLQQEISKGSDVYTRKELDMLINKLNETYKELNTNMDQGYLM